jgi:hypothetical protein
VLCLVFVPPLLDVAQLLKHTAFAVAKKQLFDLDDGGMRLVLRHGNGVNLFENVVRALIAQALGYVVH